MDKIGDKLNKYAEENFGEKIIEKAKLRAAMHIRN